MKLAKPYKLQQINSRNEFFLDYTKYNKKAAFIKSNTGRMLACLILSETIPSVLLPYDAFEAELFFNHNFKRLKQNIDELLDYYKSICKIEKQCVPQKFLKNKGIIDALV